MFFRKKVVYVEKRSKSSKYINIATIISIALATIKAAYFNIISIEIAALILIGSVILLAIGSSISKIIIALVSAYVFFKSTTNGDELAFTEAFTYFIALVIVLFGFYVMFGGMSRKK
ncbi:hypothetical protein BFP78_00130 [Gaetbulibacter sp. 5U11]|nr:hypothetical protein BFP78_00130 [Gaetbulibacter sp. 5U11]